VSADPTPCVRLWECSASKALSGGQHRRGRPQFGTASARLSKISNNRLAKKFPAVVHAILQSRRRGSSSSNVLQCGVGSGAELLYCIVA